MQRYPKPKTISVIAPAHNEEKNIPLLFQALELFFSTHLPEVDWKMIIAVDPGTDKTVEVLEILGKADSRIQAVVLSQRFGQQMAIVAALDHANSDVVVMMDADLQHPPKVILELISCYEEGHDVVYTIRRTPKDINIFKSLSSRLFYWFLNGISDVQLFSGEADFRLISRRVAHIFQTQMRERNQFLRGLFKWVGFPQKGIYFEANLRTHGKSKFSWNSLFKLAFNGLIGFSKKPLKFAIFIGLFFAIFGLFFTVVVLCNYFVSNKTPSGWSTLSILISVFGGMQMFFLGVLGEYIGAIFDEVKKRPLYLVEKKINVN